MIQFLVEHNAAWVIPVALILFLFYIFGRNKSHNSLEKDVNSEKNSSDENDEQDKPFTSNQYNPSYQHQYVPNSTLFPGVPWAENHNSEFEAAKQRDWMRGELEFHHQPEEYKMRANPDENVTLGRLLNIFDIGKDEIGDMYVVSRYHEMQGQLIQNIEHVWNYDLCAAILDENNDGEISPKFAEHVVLSIWYKRNKNESESDELYKHEKYKGTFDLIIVHLRDSGAHSYGTMGKDTYYVCATVCIPPFAYTKQKMAVTEYERLQGKVTSITFTYDKRSSEQKLAEFRYIREDAIDKIKNNQADELSDIQRFFINNVRENIEKDFYFGKKSMEERSYGNAIEYFQNIYECLNSEWSNRELSDDDKNFFFESCYWLGYCFCELGLYEKALYYLDIVWYVDNIAYKSEYVNCLVNKKDFRSFSVVTSEIKRISEIEHPNAESSGRYERYYQFLKRRIVYLYVEKDKLDEAEIILKDMLDKKQDEDFALNELAYIQQIRNQ